MPAWVLCRYTKGLPPNVIKMNTECLKLRPHDHPGYQTITQIKVCVERWVCTFLVERLRMASGGKPGTHGTHMQEIVRQAVGDDRDSDTDEYIDTAMDDNEEA